jgi:hypothetical protein
MCCTYMRGTCVTHRYLKQAPDGVLAPDAAANGVFARLRASVLPEAARQLQQIAFFKGSDESAAVAGGDGDDDDA